jgi:hypothetical protein
MKRALCGIITILIVQLALSVAYAEDFKVYPGAKLDEQLTKEATQQAAQANIDSKPSIYVTDDSFDKVFSFYQGIGKEYQMSYAKPDNVQRLPSGKELKAAFFIFDGASDLASSKKWIRIQRPYIGPGMKEGPDKTYINLVENP